MGPKFKVGDKVKWNGKRIDERYLINGYPKNEFTVKKITLSCYDNVKFWIDYDFKSTVFYPETILEKANDLKYHINILNEAIKELKK